MNITKRIKELAEFLNCDTDEISVSTYDENLFEYDDQEYLVLTDTEADNYAENYIKDTLWAFNAEFIIDECNIDPEWADSIRVMQERCCESCNSLILAIIEGSCGIDAFVYDAIRADGRGHYIAQYDGHENETDNYYIYRIN